MSRTSPQLAVRDLLATIWPIVLLTLFGFVVAYQFVEPAPPRHLTIATGSESGAYYAFAKRYATLLARNGITLEVQTSAGSYENLERLRKGAVDVAFVQGGIVSPARDAESEKPQASAFKSLGSVYYEPVWLFYRGAQTIDKLYQLAGKRIAVGAEGSGIRGLALQLLAANDIAADNPSLLPLAGTTAADALQQGTIDAAFFVAAPEAPVVQTLLHASGVRLMSFNQADAYTHRFDFLSKIVLPQSVFDLVRNNPPQDTVMLATTANLIVSDKLHPALASLLLQAVSEVHGQHGFFQRAGEFPAYKDRSFTLSEDAQRYYQSGPSLLQRYLPFWLAVLVERLSVMLVPLIALLLPLLRAAPAIYSWRIRSKIFRCYGELKFLEDDLRQHYDPAQHARYLERLERIEEEANTRNIPVSFSDLLYTLREHIELVRHKLLHLQSATTKMETTKTAP